MAKPSGISGVIRKQNVSSNDSEKCVGKTSLDCSLINFENVKRAFDENLIPELRNQTFFKDKDGNYPSLTDVAENNNDFELMEFLFKQGIIPDIPKPLGRPLFMWIMDQEDLSCNIDLIKELIDAGHDINCQDPNGRPDDKITPLSRSIIRGNEDLAKFLIENGANINPPCVALKYCTGCLPLSLAIEHKYDQLVDLLLKNEVDVNQQCKGLGTALSYASLNGDTKLIQRLLDTGANVNGVSPQDGRTALHFVLLDDKEEVLKVLLNHYSLDLNFMYAGESYVHVACNNNSKKCINYLLDANPNVNIIDGETHFAIDYTYTRPKAANKLKKHIVRLCAAGFYLSDQNLKAVAEEKYDSYLAECCKQVEVMKTTTILPKSHVSFYDLLFMTHEKLAMCLESMNNQFILLSEYRTKFPSYIGMIEYKLKKAYQLIKLRATLNTAVYRLFNNHIPCIIMEKIFSYFNAEELVQLQRC